MKHSIVCHIPLHPLQYEITVKTGQLQQGDWIDKIALLAARFVIITDDNIKETIGQKILQLFQSKGLKTDLLASPAGEQYKTRETKQKLEDRMLQLQCGRDTCLITLGGGVVSDLGGFIASTYNRGIPLFMIPTSLLAMVDAGIGGKNGVDTPEGKNLIGTFYQPKQILIDPDLLKTLPINEIRNGLVEMIKHALITDADYFKFFQTHVDQILQLDSETMEKAIYKSCVIKKTIVEEDEKETGKRRLLNCGHTIAHAVEHLSKYAIAHGEAVAIGIVIEGYAASQLGYLPMDDLNTIIALFKRFGIPLRNISKINPADIIKTLILDKKSYKGKPRFVLLEKIGVPVAFEGHYCTTVDDDQLLNAVKWYNHAMRDH